MSKRKHTAWGSDDASESKGAVTSGKVPSRGSTKDMTPSKSDEPSKRQHTSRMVRAFGFLDRAKESSLYESNIGTEAERQAASVGEVGVDLGGVNSSGRTLKAVDPYFVDNFQGRSGQPDNQSINRGKGRT